MSSQNGTPRSIILPKQDDVFRNLKNAKRFAIDIGGSLTKIAYYSTVSLKRALYDEDPKSTDTGDILEQEVEVGRLHFVKFETRHIASCLSFIQKHLVGTPDFMRGKSVKATGGGAYKYTDLLTSTLGVTLDKEDEMECLIKGCNFLLKNIPDEVFEYKRHSDPEYRFHSADPDVFPYLLVNIGSGVSIMKVESDSKYERIAGSAMGGGSFWGLGSLLTNAKGFDELLELAEQGDHRNVDMLVKDIYGGNYESQMLPADLIACSFGKAILGSPHYNPGRQFASADIARSLLFMISNDIGQLGCLYAMMHGLKRVYFGGYFLRGHPLSMHSISFAINYWSKGKVQALFLRHEGYLGAIGAFLKGAEEIDTEKYSWQENYAGSSGLRSPIPTKFSNHNDALIDQLEMDRFEWQLMYCPLLRNPSTYVPDTVDLTQDLEARRYWLTCFEGAIGKFKERAIQSQPHQPDATARGSLFQEKYLARLHYLKDHPFAYGSLTVRSLLDMREHCLLEFGFPDPYLQQKRCENEAALKVLGERLFLLDDLKWQERWKDIVTGLLAGNVFDWGAREVANILESDPNFSFKDAQAKLQARPWLMDSLDAWITRLEGPPHKCASIFVDNSGMDIVMGVLPFARELLKRGTKVHLCANTKPALNDVTHQELEVLLHKVANICPIIKNALDSSDLLVLDSGQSSPCLDLSRLNVAVCKAMQDYHTDLIIIEGMGRAIHTNLEAKFSCEAIKAAVLKNQWLANRHGGQMFSVVFKYEPALS